MAPRRNLPDAIQHQVRQRAAELCEYCHTAEQWQYILFTIDHIVPISHGGTDDPENLALACFHCNRRKSNQLTANDPQTNETVPLFNPRLQPWSEHFIWSSNGLQIVGLTPTGRATIACLDLNRDRVILLRAADTLVNRHPPEGDPIQKPK